MHQVQSADANGRVVDTEGNSFRMSMVKAIPKSTVFVPVPEFAMGGSRKVEDRRREALRQWLPMLLERIKRAGVRGLSVQQASKDLATVPGFSRRSGTSAPRCCSSLSCGPTKLASRSEERRTSCERSVHRKAACKRSSRRRSQTPQRPARRSQTLQQQPARGSPT